MHLLKKTVPTKELRNLAAYRSKHCSCEYQAVWKTQTVLWPFFRSANSIWRPSENNESASTCLSWFSLFMYSKHWISSSYEKYNN